jgi:DNA-binding NarL/FixJ family response regulator
VTKSVLVVDDDAAFRALAARMLKALGLEIAGEAATAADGIAAANDLRPDAALVDIRLPDGDGITLARQLAALPWQPRVLLTSSDPDAASAAEIRRSGATAFIPKEDLPTSAELSRLLDASGSD